MTAVQTSTLVPEPASTPMAEFVFPPRQAQASAQGPVQTQASVAVPVSVSVPVQASEELPVYDTLKRGLRDDDARTPRTHRISGPGELAVAAAAVAPIASRQLFASSEPASGQVPAQPQLQSQLQSQSPQAQSQVASQSPLQASPQQPVNIPDAVGLAELLQLRSLVRGARANAAVQARQLVQLAIRFNVTHRLAGSLGQLFAALADQSPSDAAQFASTYQQVLETCEQLLGSGSSVPTLKSDPGFPSLLTWAHRQLLNSFLTLVKSSPSFVVTALLSMSASDVQAFVRGPVDSFDRFSSLHRDAPLDILWTAIFPPDVQGSQRLEYFAAVCAGLLREKRCERVCYAVFDRVVDASGHPYSGALETALLSFLQEGNFLCTRTGLSPDDVSETNTPVSETPSPDFAAMTLRPDRAKSTAVNGSTQAPERRPSVKSDNSFKASSSSLRSVAEEALDSRSAEFLDTAVTRILELLASDSSDALPRGFVLLGRMIMAKLPPEHRQNAILFMVVRYFICRHLYRVVTRPERLGILADYYIGDTQRQRILHPIFRRLYRLAMGYAYGWSGASMRLDADHAALLDKIMAKFDDGTATNQPEPLSGPGDSESGAFAVPGQLLVLSPLDVVSLYGGLFPSFALHRQSASSRNADRRQSHGHSHNHGHSHSHSHQSHSRNHSHRRGRTHTRDSSAGSDTFVATLQNNQAGAGIQYLTEMDQIPDYGDDSDVDTAPSPSMDPPAEDDYEWSLDDIKRDMEPVILEITKKFPYLQMRGASVHSLRAGRANHLKVPPPAAECWQVFRVGDDLLVSDVTEETLLARPPVDFGDDSTTAPTTPWPCAPANRGVLHAVQRAVERVADDIAGSEFPVSFAEREFHNGVLYSAADGAIAPLDGASGNEFPIERLLTEAVHKHQARGDYMAAFEASTAVAALRKLVPASGTTSYAHVSASVNNFVVNALTVSSERQLRALRKQVDQYAARTEPFEVYLETARRQCDAGLAKLRGLRTKVWYVAEVRPSALWIRAKQVATLLSKEGADGNGETAFAAGPPPVPPAPPAPMKRNNSSSSLSSLAGFSFKRLGSVSRRGDYASRRHSLVSLSHASQQPMATATTADTMFAPRELAGAGKLLDREAEATKKWLEGQNIQNLCAGEERIHRFFCEVDDLVKRIMGDALSASRRSRGHSLLCASALFRHDVWKTIIEVDGAYRSSVASVNAHRMSFGAGGLDDFDRPSARSRGNTVSDGNNSSAAAAARSQSSRGHRSQVSSPNILDMFTSLDLGRRSSITEEQALADSFHRRSSSAGGPDAAAAAADAAALTSPVSPAEADEKRRALDALILELHMSLVSLVYSDIGTECWADGSEIDRWLSSSLVQRVLSRHDEPTQPLIQSTPSSPIPPTSQPTKFDFDNAYNRVLEKLAVTPSPTKKLDTLYELVRLVVCSLSTTSPGSHTPASIRSHRTRSNMTSLGSETLNGKHSMHMPGKPSIGDSLANAEVRRASLSSHAVAAHFGGIGGPAGARFSTGPNTDAIAEELRRVFRARTLKRATLFRDLQVIASFVPPRVLDMSDSGKAFWDVSLAALSLKEETIGHVVDTATEIFQVNTGLIKEGVDHDFVSQFTLADCARLWSIAAKEGDLHGQRELAMMYLSHPSITPVCLPPFTRLHDVYDAATLDDASRLTAADMDKYDPTRMALIKHWMSSAAARGDVIASEYLLQQVYI